MARSALASRTSSRTTAGPARPAAGDVPAPLTDPKFAPTVVWYRLHTLTDLLSRPFWRDFARPHELNKNEWRVLVSVAYRPRIAAHEICELTGLAPMNVSRALARLRAQGRVRESRDPGNRSRKLITITASGLALYKQLLPSLEELSQLVDTMVSQEEQAQLTRLVEKLIARFEALERGGGEPVPAAASAGRAGGRP